MVHIAENFLSIFQGTIILVAGVVSGLLLLVILLLTVKTEKKYRSIHEIRKSRSNSTKPSTSRSSSSPRYSGRHDSVNLERYHSDHQRKSSPDDHQRRSSPDDYQRKSRHDDHQRKSSPDDHQRRSSPDDYQRNSRHDDHQRKSSPDDHQRRSSPDDYQRKSSQDDHQRKSSPDDHQRRSSPDDYQRKSSQDDQQRKSRHDDHQRKSSHNNDKHAYSTNRDSNKNQAKNTRSMSYRSANYRPESIKSRQSRERIDTTIMTVLTRVSNSDESSGGCCTYPFRVQKPPIGSISSCAYFLNELAYAEFNEVNSMNNSIREITLKNNNFDSVSSIKKHQTRNPSNINKIPLERRSCVKKKTILTNKKNYWKNCIHVILRRSLDHAVLWKKKSGMLETVKEVIKELKCVQNTNIICKNTTVVPKIQLLDTNIKEHSEYFNQNQQVALNDTTSCRKYGNVGFEVEEDFKKYNSDDLEETNDYSIETNLSKCKHTPPAKELTLDYFSTYNNDLTKILPYQIPISKNDNNQHEINEKRDQQCYQLCNELTQKSMLPGNTILNKEPVIMEENTISLCTTETAQPKIDNFEQNSSVKSLLLKDESNLKTRNTTLKGTKSFIPVKKSFQKSCDESKQGNVEQSVEKIEKYSLLPKEENFASINMTTVNSPVEVTHLKLDQTIKMHVPFDTKQEINNMQGIHKTAQKVKQNTRINEARKLVARNIGKFMKYVTTKENKIIVDDIMNAFCIRPEYEKWIKLFGVNDVETDRNKLRQQYKIIKSFERAIVAVNNFANGKKMKKKAKNSRQRKAEDCLIVFGRSQGELKRYTALIGNYLDTAEEGLGPLLVEHGPPFDPSAFPTRGLLRLEGDHLQARRLISGLLHHPSGHFSHALLLFGEPVLLDGLLEYCGSVARIKYNRELRVHTPPPGSRLYDFVLKNLLNPPIKIKKSSITTDIPHLNILWRSTFFFQENEINNHTFTIAMNFLSTISTNKMIKITKEESTDLKRIQNIYQDFLSVQIQKDRLQVPFKIIEILLKNLKTMKRREMIVKLVNTQIKNVNHSLSLSKKQPKINNVENQMKRDLDNAVTRYYETFGEFDYC